MRNAVYEDNETLVVMVLRDFEYHGKSVRTIAESANVPTAQIEDIIRGELKVRSQIIGRLNAK